jgi:hypothetical protein
MYAYWSAEYIETNLCHICRSLSRKLSHLLNVFGRYKMLHTLIDTWAADNRSNGEISRILRSTDAAHFAVCQTQDVTVLYLVFLSKKKLWKFANSRGDIGAVRMDRYQCPFLKYTAQWKNMLFFYAFQFLIQMILNCYRAELRQLHISNLKGIHWFHTNQLTESYALH